ncbi:MAG TPA: hypothetical protein VLK65_12720 [Vicinamibacteria bacterium]|nr:hypothetical protein [Vicinamibacteria bacterium]
MRAFALTLLGLSFPLSIRAQSEPTIFIAGVWPDRILFFDQTKDEFSEGLRLRHGAVTDSSYTHDKRRFFLITDRMESVEVVDPVHREVIDELKLSTPELRVRIFGVFPNPAGTRVYLTVSLVRLLPDRYLRDQEYDIVLYDFEKHDVVERFSLPEEVQGRGFRAPLHVPPGGESIYVLGRDIYEIDAQTHEVKDTWALSKPLLAGYGAVRGMSLTQTDEPGVFYGIYRTKDPVQEKSLFGLAKMSLYERKVESYELGPELELGRGVAISPDRKRAYAGLKDLVVVDLETRKVILRKEGFERGRTNNSLIVSHDGTKLYISGVGDTVWVYDAASLELVKTVHAGGDFMMPPVEIPNPRLSKND